MYRTLFVFNNYELYLQMKKLPVWGKVSGFDEGRMVQDGNSAYEALKSSHFDLVISEIRITGQDGLQLWRKVREEGLCKYFVLCSEFPDFHYARQGIILGVFDYLVMPFQTSDLFELFGRVKEEMMVHAEKDRLKLEKLSRMLSEHAAGIRQYVFKRLKDIYKEHGDTVEADKDVRQLYETTVNGLFENNDWFSCYLDRDSFFSVHGIAEGKDASYRKYYERQLNYLFDEYHLLHPETEDVQLKQIMLYMLHHPEEDLKQSTLAQRLYLNSSYLSTVFTAKTGQKFSDYLTNLKLKRAGVLLRSSDMKVAELAEELGYKDTAYFSRLFKKQYQMTPTEYRIPEGYDFMI